MEQFAGSNSMMAIIAERALSVLAVEKVPKSVAVQSHAEGNIIHVTATATYDDNSTLETVFTVNINECDPDDNATIQ